MTLMESLLYSGLSALFSVFCWFVRFAWKRWRKKRQTVKPDAGGPEDPGDKLTEEVKDIPFTVCGNVLKGAGESAIEAFVEEDRRCCCCRIPRCCCCLRSCFCH
ncbi:hypothetical protein ONE63_000235 [Megalurothrips usitatus]|uniref:Uncharacterized protein n=1 Tax=Megalurothrips usitatus TaxID=439358 RepID=A0AAV7Y4M4_9NEOP|nr:hypothetical protein ONE63_000235 [Megalurothrips usitatus]